MKARVQLDSWEEGFRVVLPKVVRDREGQARRRALWVSTLNEQVLLSKAKEKFESSVFCQKSDAALADPELVLLLGEFTAPPRPQIIPRVVHFIWFGQESNLSKEAKRCMESWKWLNPGWEVVLWTDDKVAEAFNEWKIPSRALEDCPNYAEKSDVARYLILFMMGGVYCDVDLECLQSLDAALLTYDFVASFANVDSNCEVGNSFLAASPKHPLMKALFDESCSVTAQISRAADPTSPEGTLSRTGPGALTRLCASNCISMRNWLLLPPSFVYPIPNDWCTSAKTAVLDWAREESFAVHLWQKSW